MSGTAPRDQLTPVGDTTGRPVYYDPDRGTYHVWYDDATYEPVSTALLFAVSSVIGVDPEALEPLSARIEPDALNELCSHWHRHWHGDRDGPRVGEGEISFTYSQCDVTVQADGEIVIDPDPTAGESV